MQFKNKCALNLAVVLHTKWQFCSPHLKTGSLGSSRAERLPRCAQFALCIFPVQQHPRLPVAPSPGDVEAQLVVALPGDTLQPLAGLAVAGEDTRACGGSATRGETRAVFCGGRGHRASCTTMST